MPSIHANRRAVIGALATLPALCAVSSHAAQGMVCLPTTDTDKWDAAMARFLRIKAESDHFDNTVFNPVYDKVKAAQPDYKIVKTAKNGQTATIHCAPGDFQRFEPDASGVDDFLHIRTEITALKAKHARYVKLCDRLNYDVLAERSDQYGELLGEAMNDLMDIPAPHGAAVLWKLENAFGKDACGYGGSIPCYDIGYVEVFFDDIRRIAGVVA